MNQDLDRRIFALTPDAGRTALEATLASLLVPGDIMDRRLGACCNRLQQRFDLFSATCPVPQWDEGLVITPEIRCQTEIYLPLAEIQAAFCHLLSRACCYAPFLPAVPIFSALSWVDALERIRPAVISFNPARTIADIAGDQTLRRQFLAALFVPARYGGGFDRYPLQKKFLQGWLAERNQLEIAVLDAACGSGEGVYELAAMVAAAGFRAGSTVVHGCTVEPLELAAAAHGWFPHDPGRELAAEGAIAGALQMRGAVEIEFFREDVCAPAEIEVRYDLVVCNGLLGGPLLHEEKALEVAVSGLAKRVKKGGLLLAADRFHDGWRRIVPRAKLESLFVKNGLRCLDLAEGAGAIRT